MNYYRELEYEMGPEGPNVEDVWICRNCNNYAESCDCSSNPSIPIEPLLTPVFVEVFIPVEYYDVSDTRMTFSHSEYLVEVQDEGMELVLEGN